MDQVRQIRYLVAPFFFFASLLWGSHLAHKPAFDVNRLKELAPLVVASFFPVGFLVGALSHGLTRWLIKLWTGRPSEIALSHEALKNIWSKIGRTGDVDSKFEFYASATFDHEVVADRVHEWI